MLDVGHVESSHIQRCEFGAGDSPEVTESAVVRWKDEHGGELASIRGQTITLLDNLENACPSLCCTLPAVLHITTAFAVLSILAATSARRTYWQSGRRGCITSSHLCTRRRSRFRSHLIGGSGQCTSEEASTSNGSLCFCQPFCFLGRG